MFLPLFARRRDGKKRNTRGKPPTRSTAEHRGAPRSTCSTRPDPPTWVVNTTGRNTVDVGDGWGFLGGMGDKKVRETKHVQHLGDPSKTFTLRGVKQLKFT